MKYQAYYRLMRFHKPLGILLLWIPTAWALWLANQGKPAWSLVLYFLLGTICMRAAGCVVNDVADRHIDKHVCRTTLRPLTSGEVGLVETMGLLVALLFVAYFIVSQLPTRCFHEALIALLVTLIYPFCKRFFEAPQLILGVAFSMGIPMAYTASGVSPNVVMILLCVLNFAWIVAYDTMYAMADRDDDLLIGVKSTAILFGRYDRLIIGLLQFFYHSVWLVISLLVSVNPVFYMSWGIGLGILIYQQYLLSLNQHENYVRAFSMNAWYGMMLWVAFMGG